LISTVSVDEVDEDSKEDGAKYKKYLSTIKNIDKALIHGIIELK
jgi:hypothetical protein